MKRRTFLARTVPAALGSAIAGCTSADDAPAVQTNTTVRWRLTSSFATRRAP